MTTEPKPKRIRKPRTNWERLFKDLQTYCEVTREAVNAYVPDGESKTGQLLALDAVIGRMKQ